MKKFIFLIILIPVTTVLSQNKYKINKELCGQLQFISEYVDNCLYFKKGKTDLGVKIFFNDLFGLKLVYKVYSDYNVALFDGYCYISPMKDTEIKFGQFKNPFSLERLTPPFKRFFIEEAIATQIISNRDFGVGLDYKTSFLEFNSTIFNGEGMNKIDINKDKDFVIRSVIIPIENFKIGGAIYLGKTGPDSLLQDKDFYNFQFQYKFPFKYIIQTEYTESKSQINPQRAYYIIVGAFIPEKITRDISIEGLARYQYYKSNDVSSEHYITFGVNLYPMKNYNVRIQINYRRSLTDESILKSGIVGALYYAF